MTYRRTYEKTPSGGDYSEIYYLDNTGRIVDETEATMCVIRACKQDGTLVQETFGVIAARNSED